MSNNFLGSDEEYYMNLKLKVGKIYDKFITNHFNLKLRVGEIYDKFATDHFNLKAESWGDI